MSLVCSAVSVALPTVGTEAISGALTNHVKTCDACSSEFAGYEVMYESLADLRYAEMPPPYGLQSRVMASLGPVEVPDAEDRWEHAMPVAAAGLATAAAGTAVLFRIYRHHAT